MLTATPAVFSFLASCDDVYPEPAAAQKTGAPAPSATTTASAMPSASTPMPTPAPTFFTPDERKALGALANAILPPDDQPGGEALGAVPYIEGLLTAFEQPTPTIFAGGPFSSRNPYPDKNGAMSTKFPTNDIGTFLPLDRYNEAAWRLTIYGSSGLPNGGPNDGVTGPIVGYRDQLRNGIAAAIANNGGQPIDGLDQDTLNGIYKGLPKTFRELLYDLVCEAAFALPEYGGNLKMAGWKMVHFEGDVMPFGFSQWDATTQSMVERADAPVSLPNPGSDPEPLDDDSWNYVELIVNFLGGKVYS
jgi:hypothetical protein